MKQHMKKTALTATFLATGALAQTAGIPLKVEGITPNRPIPEKFAHCVADPAQHTKDGGNISPALSWGKGPAGTQSYAIVMHDPDVPQVFDNANKEGKTLAESLPRRNFYHWVLVDIPANIHALPEGLESKGISAQRATGKQEYGVRGKNDYSKSTPIGGYDGPCPPWNDIRLHHYIFTVYALDVPSLHLPEAFDGRQAMDAIKPHVLAEGSVTGVYTQNPDVKP